MDVYFLIRTGFAFSVSVLIVRRALINKSLDISGAIAALIVGFVLTITNFCFFAALLVFFLSSSKLTKYKSEIKRDIEDDYKEGGQRNWVQVVCNGGIACLLSLIYFLDNGYGERPINYAHEFDASLISVAIIGAISCSCGDTWSSELGTAYPLNTPRLITTFRQVPIGTNGGVTAIGLFASVIGGFFVGLSYLLVLFASVYYHQGIIPNSPPQWPIIIIGVTGGFIGSVIDSVLGATVQYSGYCTSTKKIVNKPSPTAKHISGFPLLDNHVVNLVSSAVTSVSMAIFGYYLWQFVDMYHF